MKIRIIGTGGTIASVDRGNGRKADLYVDEIMSYVPDVRDRYEFTTVDLVKKDSTNMRFKDYIGAALEIYKSFKENYNVLMLHGTDTLQNTAEVLSFMMPFKKRSVLYTGSMEPILYPNGDAEGSIRDSMLVTSDNRLSGDHVLFNHKVYLGTRAAKVRDSYDAYDSINYPLIGNVNGDLSITHNVKKCRPFSNDNHGSQLLMPNMGYVKLAKLQNDFDPDKHFDYELSDLKEKNIKGIVIEAFGSGGLPNTPETIALVPKIKKLIDAGIYVVITSRVPHATVDPNAYEVNKGAIEAGALIAYDMFSDTVDNKLRWVLGQTDKPEYVKKLMLYNFGDEINPNLVPEADRTSDQEMLGILNNILSNYKLNLNGSSDRYYKKVDDVMKDIRIPEPTDLLT